MPDDARPTLAPPPDHPVRSVLVLGAGLAGAQTVAALRTHGFDGRVTLVGREPIAPYDRPPCPSTSSTGPSRPG